MKAFIAIMVWFIATLVAGFDIFIIWEGILDRRVIQVVLAFLVMLLIVLCYMFCICFIFCA